MCEYACGFARSDPVCGSSLRRVTPVRGSWLFVEFGHLFAFKLLALALPLFRADFSNLQRHTGKKSMQVTGQPARNAES